MDIKLLVIVSLLLACLSLADAATQGVGAKDPMDEMINDDKSLEELIKEAPHRELDTVVNELKPIEVGTKSDGKSNEVDNERDRVKNGDYDEDEEEDDDPFDDDDDDDDDEDSNNVSESSSSESESKEVKILNVKPKIVAKKEMNRGASPVKSEINQEAHNKNDNQIVKDQEIINEKLENNRQADNKKPSVFNQLYIVVPIGVIACCLVIFGAIVLVKKRINKSNRSEKTHRNPRNPIYQEVTQAETA